MDGPPSHQFGPAHPPLIWTASLDSRSATISRSSGLPISIRGAPSCTAASLSWMIFSTRPFAAASSRTQRAGSTAGEIVAGSIRRAARLACKARRTSTCARARETCLVRDHVELSPVERLGGDGLRGRERLGAQEFGTRKVERGFEPLYFRFLLLDRRLGGQY